MISGRRAYRRDLPHYQNDFKTYFVTFVTRQRMVLPAPARTTVLCHVVDCSDYTLHVAVVMPDHVHLIASPLLGDDGWSMPLCDIIGRIKGASARQVNLQMKRNGSLWQQEAFDHQLRNKDSLAEKCEYVRQNPVRRGLVSRPEDYEWLWPR